MNRYKLFMGVAVLILIGSVWTAVRSTQQITSAGSFSISQGGNLATVTAQNALKVDPSAVTQPVSGTFWQGTQPVSGPLTDAQLRATAVPVSGSLASTPLTGCGSTNYDSGIITLPNSTTVLTATATCVNAIILFNLTNSQQTCTVTDGQGTPANLIPPTFDIQPKGDVTFVRHGVKALSGIKWSCTNASAVAGIVRGQQ